MSQSSTTRSGGNASGLPSAKPFGTLSRRAAMLGALTVGSLKASGHLPLPASPDVDLIALAHRLKALIGVEHEAWNRRSAAEDDALEASPPTPIRREVKGAYAGLDGLPPEQRFAKLLADPTDFWAESDAADAEHKTAMAEHARAVEVIEKRLGIGRLARQACRASSDVRSASVKLAELQATTAAGVAAKARALLSISGDRPPQTVEWADHEALLGSLLEDAARLGTGASA